MQTTQTSAKRPSGLPTSEDMVANIRQTLALATADEVASGRRWYPSALELCEEWATEYDLPVETVVGLLAAISPRLAWLKNVDYAARMLATGDAPLLGVSKAKGLRLLGGESPDIVLAPPVKTPRSGQKVRAFFTCILLGARTDAVCIDRHAFDVALGCEGTDASRKVLDRVGAYESIAEAYRIVAAEAGLAPSEVQAITWTTWRRLKGIVD